MSLAALLRPLGALWVLVAFVAMIAAITAAAVGEPHLAPFFAMTAGMALVPGLLVLAATNGFRTGASALDALGLAFLAWVTTPAVAALPFWLTGYFDPLDSLFEAYSAVTTTGATLLPEGDLPRSLIFWRALLAWLGGYATLLLAIGVFAALDREIPVIRRSAILTIRPRSVFFHLPQAARRVGIIYAVLTAFIWLGLLFSGNGLFDATVLALGSISTSGYTPYEGSLVSTIGPVSTMWVAIGCLVGAMNISLFWDALRDRTAFRDPDIAGIAALIIGLTLLYALADQNHILTHALDALFVVTTAGYSASGDPSPVILGAVFAALIGGAAASTTGGIKVSRILLLWQRMGSELAVLSDPSSVVPVRFRDRPARDSSLIGIWAYVLGFAACLGIGGILLAVSEVPFDHSFLATAAALSNTGPLYDQVDGGWRAITAGGKTTLIAAMILGRLEVLAALGAVWAIFIRK